MGTKKLVYWINMNTDIKKPVKKWATCMVYQQTQSHEKTIPEEMPYKSWKVVGTDIFTIKNKTLFCIVDYYSKFSVGKKAGGLLADSLNRAVKIMFAELGLQKKVVSNAGTNYQTNLNNFTEK